MPDFDVTLPEGYEALKHIGCGSYGTVWLVREVTSKEVTIFVLIVTLLPKFKKRARQISLEIFRRSLTSKI